MAKTINGVPFRQWLVPSSKYSIKAPYSMVPKKITLHNTDNEMPAHNEISYMRSNNNQTSYHVAIDEKEAVQGIPYNRNAWAAGDGLNGYGNRNTVHVEICRNYDRTRKTTKLNEPLASQYSKAEQNTIKFVAQLCIDLGIVANNANIKTHNDWNGKWCPSKILNEGRLQLVKNAIIVEYNRLKGGGGSAGWVQDKKGWWYRRANGGYPKSGWERIADKWYLFDSQGYMLTGWQKSKNVWYYLNSSGAMQTGWQKVKDIWYYMNQSGAMQTGWLKDKNKWYYLNSSGAMQTGWLKDKEKWYYLNSSGAMQTGWVQVKEIWYYLNSSGAMQTGWIEDKGKWYYLNSSGAMQTGLITVGGKHYYLQRNGVLITEEIIELEANKHGHLK